MNWSQFVTSSKGKQLYGNAKIIYHQKRFTSLCRKAWCNGCTLCRGILDLGMINDACLTELTPEWVEENGEDRCGHSISKKFQLYKD